MEALARSFAYPALSMDTHAAPGGFGSRVGLEAVRNETLDFAIDIDERSLAPDGDATHNFFDSFGRLHSGPLNLRRGRRHRSSHSRSSLEDTSVRSERGDLSGSSLRRERGRWGVEGSWTRRPKRAKMSTERSFLRLI